LTPNFGISWNVFRRICIFGITLLIAYKFFGYVKENIAWREATRLSGMAAEDLEKNQNDLVRANLNLALSMSPNHLEASRLAARLADLEEDSRAVAYHETVLASWGAEPEDWRRGALSAARFKQLEIALKWATKAAKLSNDPSFPHLVQAEIYASQGDPFEQERELRAALAQKESPEILNALACFLLDRKNDLSLHGAEAATLLRKISLIDSGPLGLAALKTALSSGILFEDDILEWLDAYRAHPASDPASALFVDEIQMRVFPDSCVSVYQGVVSRGLALRPESRIPLARWLLQNKQAPAVLTLLPINDVIDNSSAFQCWVDASMSLKKWDQIENALVSPSNPLPPYKTQALRATIAGMSGDSAKSEKLWREVLLKYRSQPDVFLQLLVRLTYAGKWEMLYAELPVLLNDPSWALKTVETLIPVARQHADSTIMLEFYNRTLKSRFLFKDALPNDRAAYTKLILGDFIPLDELESRSRKYPENASFRLTYALGLLKSGSKMKALFELKDVEPLIQVNALLPHQKAVYAAIVAANGQVEEAQGIIKMISFGSLTRQEEALVSPLSAAKKVN
jgi:hypothetical protein